jgi:hypothetical protein
MRVVLLSRDLLFITKIKEVAAAHQREVVVAKSETALNEALTGGAGVVLIDLEKAPIALEVIKGALSAPNREGWKCVSFFSHVHLETADSARALGLGEVMPRSKFVQLLPHLLSSL